MNEETLGAAEADSVVEVVRAVRGDAVAADVGVGADAEMRGEIFHGRRLVGRSDAE